MGESWIQPDAPATVNMKLRRDADYSIPFRFKESESGPNIDLTGFAFECEFLRAAEDDTPLFSVTVSEDDLANGLISIPLTRTQTEDKATMPRDLYWRLWWTDTTAKRSRKIAGRVRMEE